VALFTKFSLKNSKKKQNTMVFFREEVLTRMHTIYIILLILNSTGSSLCFQNHPLFAFRNEKASSLYTYEKRRGNTTHMGYVGLKKKSKSLTSCPKP